MGNETAFNEEMVRFVCAEMSAALDFLKIKNIVHRDVKPENILLDEKGHCHLTDFNVATYLNKGCYLKNMAGTKPYMAPEIFKVQFITFYLQSGRPSQNFLVFKTSFLSYRDV